MAVLDPSRTSVELSEAELAAASALLEERVTDETVLAALEAAGIVRNGAIVPYVARLLTVVAEPKLRIVVERYVAERAIVENVWAIERLAVWGSDVRGGGAVELRPVEPTVLPMEIVRAVGLGPRPAPAIERELHMPVPTFEGLEELVALDDPDAMAALLADAGFDAESRGVLIKLMLDRRSSWRASSLWTDPAGERMEAVAVIDGGNSGFWLMAYEERDDGQSFLRMRPATSSEVWDRILELMPWGSEERAPADPTTPFGDPITDGGPDAAGPDEQPDGR